MKNGLEFKITDKQNKEIIFRQDKCPTQKMIEFMQLTPENYPELKTSPDWIEKNAEFIASLFDDKKVTKSFLLNNIDSWAWGDFVDMITDQMIGVDPKKVITDQKTE